MSRWLVDDVPVFWGGFQPLLTFLSQRKPHGDALQSPAPCTALWGSSQTLGRGDRELRTWPVFPKRGDPSLRLLPLPGLACVILSTHADSALDTERQSFKGRSVLAHRTEGTGLPCMLLILRLHWLNAHSGS